ncbi:MAG: 1-acyl-sn-glycerol-3-phosphate acyltransferase [Deltaproteobacteria bacterium]|nr:1-acyl-sn-glycerol-3-phosphate acyltransferase [Deltaproteobacteria bacterium]MBW2323994.1 1-acyl-sn-glycerol-3-phosphate acyltransferase [Deltaproteobacteria bacterium]
MNFVMVYGFVIILIVTPPMYLMALLTTLWDRRGNGVHIVARIYARLLIWCGFVRIHVQGKENLAPGENYVFAANHSSIFDILVLLAYLPIQFRWLAKKSLFSLPLYGHAMSLAGYIPIDRSNPREGLKSLDQAAEKMRKGVSVIIFPEGTRSDNGKIQEFKRGGFILAVKSGLPIIPVSISGAHRVMPARTFKVMPGRIKLVFGKPIPTKGVKRSGQQQLMTEVREVMEANYDPKYGDKRSSSRDDVHE